VDDAVLVGAGSLVAVPLTQNRVEENNVIPKY
jgi:hypothetical protein